MAAVVQAAAGKEYTTAGPRNVQLGLEDYWRTDALTVSRSVMHQHIREGTFFIGGEGGGPG